MAVSTPVRVTLLALAMLSAADIMPAMASTSVAVAEPYELNANMTQAGRYSYTAFIGPGCTGTLISQHTIITAAHCFGPENLITFNTTKLFASFGTDFNTLGRTTFHVTNGTSVAVHPSYNATTNERDIAVMRIDLTQFDGPPLPFSVGPIGGYAQAPITPADYNATLVSIGWGTVDPKATIDPGFLRDVQLTLRDPDSPECQGVDNKILFDGTGFCTLGAFPNQQEVKTLPGPVFPASRKDACNGDSGGPIIVPGASAAQDLLIGTVTTALEPDQPRADYTECGDRLLGGLETSVGANVAFINSMLDQYEGTGLPRVNITNVDVSQVVWEGLSLGSARLDFLVSMTITTDYYMRPRGEYIGIATPSWPELAIKAVYKKRNTTTTLPFEVVAFDIPSFTYTLSASDYQVVTGITWDVFKGHLDLGTSLEILFKAPGRKDFGATVATLSRAQLLRALCSADIDRVALKLACSND